MSPLSPLKSRRLRAYKGEPTQQVIVFRIEREWFALPIFAVKKVVRNSDAQGDNYNPGVGLTVYEGKELLVIDVAHQIFGFTRYQASLPPYILPEDDVDQSSLYSEQPAGGYLIIIRSHQGELAGLPVMSAPTVRRFTQSAMVPLPPNYATRVNINCVSGLIVQSDTEPLLFMLNPDQLLYSQPLLPPTI